MTEPEEPEQSAGIRNSGVYLGGHGNTINGPIAAGPGATAISHHGQADWRVVARLVDQLLEQIDRQPACLADADAERARSTAADLRDATSGPGADPNVVRWLLGRLTTAVGAVEPLVTGVARLAEALRPWLPTGS